MPLARIVTIAWLHLALQAARFQMKVWHVSVLCSILGDLKGRCGGRWGQTFIGLNLPLGISSHGSNRPDMSLSSFFGGLTAAGAEWGALRPLMAGEECRLAGASKAGPLVCIEDGMISAGVLV